MIFKFLIDCSSYWLIAQLDIIYNKRSLLILREHELTQSVSQVSKSHGSCFERVYIYVYNATPMRNEKNSMGKGRRRPHGWNHTLYSMFVLATFQVFWCVWLSALLKKTRRCFFMRHTVSKYVSRIYIGTCTFAFLSSLLLHYNNGPTGLFEPRSALKWDFNRMTHTELTLAFLKRLWQRRIGGS